MRTEPLSMRMFVASILGVAIAGCGGSGSTVDGTAGASNNSQGGSTSNGTGGAPAASGGVVSSPTGGTLGTGGTPATGGSSVQPVTGGAPGSGGAPATGGAKATGGMPGTGGTKAVNGGSSTSAIGGSSPLATGGSVTLGGALGTGGNNTGGSGAAAGGLATGGKASTGGSGAIAGSGGKGGSTATGTCTASKATGTNASGSGPHKVTVETNSDSGISEGTIFRPTDLGGTEKYPIFAWGEGGCSENGLSNSVAMAEIASHGYFVIADGPPNGTASRSQTSDTAGMGKPLLAYIAWAIAENEKPCSAYYHSLDTTKISTNGFSCGGLMAEGTAGDPRITTWGLNSSGLFSADQPFYKTIHTPVLIVLGGSGDMAYTNGERDYDSISALGIPIMLFSKAGAGHGGDLFSARGGDFTKIDLAWLNWWLKGDETATGKGLLVGSGCTYCTNSAWEVKSKNLP